MPGTRLSGKCVLVTRPAHQAEPLVEQLTAAGAEVECLPTIRLRDPDDRAPLLEAVSHLEDYDWVVFTSVNGVERFRAALEERQQELREIPGLRWAAIGPATARALHEAGIGVVLLPASYRAEALAEAIRESAGGPGRGYGEAEAPLRGAKVLLARAAGARAVLPERLRALGAEVDEVAAYVTESNPEAADGLRETTDDRRWDWITFTASSAVRAFAELGGHIGKSRVAVIGPITAGTAEALGFPVHVVAAEYTIPGLVRAIQEAEA
ncbi:MAG: uroporphyrinogen-III synthase [Gemmatimonadota bacterium]|jgi:uroporphyrinogen III methyltransferase/synthase|nr:MAG: uroporphyrinogen-III synthase [Gemmatimonadota bacterium]